jgi:hypothetical protein
MAALIVYNNPTSSASQIPFGNHELVAGVEIVTRPLKFRPPRHAFARCGVG